MIRILYVILSYITWWFPILVFSLPFVWAIIYHNWYKYYRERKIAARWERLGAFFAKYGDKYPEAAASFCMARFWASPQGHDTMYHIKKSEYKERFG